MKPLRPDREGAAGPPLIALAVVGVVAVALVAALLAANPFTARGGNTLTVHFYRLSEGQESSGPASGVSVVIWDQTRLAGSGVSGADGKVVIRGLPPRTLGFRYGGGPWVYYGQTIDLTRRRARRGGFVSSGPSPRPGPSRGRTRPSSRRGRRGSDGPRASP